AASAGARSSSKSIAATSSISRSHSTARHTSAPIRPRDPNTPTLVMSDHLSTVSFPDKSALPACEEGLNSAGRHSSAGDCERWWVAEEIRGLRAYLFCSHLIEAAQQFAQRTFVANYGVGAQAAHPASSAVVGKCRLAAHLPFGSNQFILRDAVFGHLGKGCPNQLENREQFARSTLPFDAPQASVGIGRLAGIDGVGQSAPFAHFDEQPGGHAASNDERQQAKRKTPPLEHS